MSIMNAKLSVRHAKPRAVYHVLRVDRQFHHAVLPASCPCAPALPPNLPPCRTLCIDTLARGRHNLALFLLAAVLAARIDFAFVRCKWRWAKASRSFDVALLIGR